MADTVTDVTTGSGEGRQTAAVPTTILSTAQARLLAHYRAFLDRYDLQEGIFCRACWQSAAEPSKIARGDAQIAVLCAHHVWFYQGALPADPLESDGVIQLVTAPKVHDRITLTDGASFDVLSVEDATLLRAYQRLLQTFAWIETLDCRVCWSTGQPSGCRAFVTPDRIAIICRHRTLQFVGATV
jgi:hypothetical protein